MSLTQQWKCQDNAASTAVVAAVGTNATLLGGDNTSTLSIADGPGTAFPRSLDLNGTDDAVDISGAGLSFASGAAFTFAAWAKFDTAAGAIWGVNGSNSTTIRKNSDTQIVLNTLSAGTLTFTVPSLGTGTWRHVLVSRTAGNSVRCFVDGVESSTGALAGATAFSPTRLGLRNATFLDGKICDARVYDSDESANVAAILAEKDAAGGTAIAAVVHHRKQQGMQ